MMLVCNIITHDIRVSFCTYYVSFIFFTMHVFANLSDISYKNHNTQETFIANSHIGAHLNNMPDLLLGLTNKLHTNKTQTSRIKRNVCINSQSENVDLEEYNVNSVRYVDTLTQDDIVREQYALLPYPPVTESYIQNMKLHYNGDVRNIPSYINIPVIVLEHINHFLYKGRNNFK